MNRIPRARSCFVTLVTLLVLVGAPALRADPLSFQFQILPPGGAVAGPPGSTVGWGYTITNLDLTNWLVPTGVSPGGFPARHSRHVHLRFPGAGTGTDHDPGL